MLGIQFFMPFKNRVIDKASRWDRWYTISLYINKLSVIDVITEIWYIDDVFTSQKLRINAR